LQLPESTALMFSEWQLVLKTSNDFQSAIQNPIPIIETGWLGQSWSWHRMDPICGDILTSWYLQIPPKQ
jgi:hypothetical protein